MDAVAAIALSGLTTASTRLAVSASNLAGMDDAVPQDQAAATPAPFVATRVETVSLGQGGVQAQLSTSEQQADPTRELVEQMQAVQQYRASVALIAADDRLKTSAIDLLG